MLTEVLGALLIKPQKGICFQGRGGFIILIMAHSNQGILPAALIKQLLEMSISWHVLLSPSFAKPYLQLKTLKALKWPCNFFIFLFMLEFTHTTCSCCWKKRCSYWRVAALQVGVRLHWALPSSQSKQQLLCWNRGIPETHRNFSISALVKSPANSRKVWNSVKFSALLQHHWVRLETNPTNGALSVEQSAICPNNNMSITLCS